MWCDVVDMDACHLLLGRPWQYDRDVDRNGRTNTYSFVYDGVKIVLLPSKLVVEKAKLVAETKTLLSMAQLMRNYSNQM